MEPNSALQRSGKDLDRQKTSFSISLPKKDFTVKGFGDLFAGKDARTNTDVFYHSTIPVRSAAAGLAQVRFIFTPQDAALPIYSQSKKFCAKILNSPNRKAASLHKVPASVLMIPICQDSEQSSALISGQQLDWRPVWTGQCQGYQGPWVLVHQQSDKNF